MYLVVRDKTINDLQALISDRKQLLRDKYKTLKTISKENKYLTDLESDYERYYSYIKQQKEEQIAAYNEIYNYLERIATNLEHTESEIENAKFEQAVILRKIKQVKSELDELITRK